MKILYGGLENYGVVVFVDENNDLFIADDQIIEQHDNKQENIVRLIEEAKKLVETWRKESKWY